MNATDKCRIMVGEFAARRHEQHARRVRSPEAPVLEQMLISGFRVRCESRLKRNAMTGPGRVCRCACADLFRPFGVLKVWVLIRRDKVPTEMSKMTPALKNHAVIKRL